MSFEVKVPNFPESVTDGTLVSWHKKVGESFKRGEILADVETDKVVFEVPAPEGGVLEEVVVEEGGIVESGQTIARLSNEAVETVSASSVSAPKNEPVQTADAGNAGSDVDDNPIITPSARKLIKERGLSSEVIEGTGKGGRVLKEDVQRYLENRFPAETPEKTGTAQGTTPVDSAISDIAIDGRPEKRVPMSRLRARIAERLVQAQHDAAMLTTFNEVNMNPVMELRKRHKETFEREHGVRLGFMPFFVKATVEALKRSPELNASIDGSDIIYHGYYDIGIAVGSDRGLVVPVLRNADRKNMAQIEATIRQYGQKAQDGKLSIEEITGGTFTITNGGVFGSMLSTPIINPPQSGILGMHKIQERPVAENGEVVIRPVMYLALSYDHRVVDGKEAVQFLVTIKELLEEPARMLLEV